LSRLDDTSRCPVANRCANCGGSDELAVATVETQVGVYCETLCTPCVDAGRWPRPRSLARTVDWVLVHLGHLGIDADQASDLLEAERRGEDELGVDR
jgi:hypothetical protein